MNTKYLHPLTIQVLLLVVACGGIHPLPNVDTAGNTELEPVTSALAATTTQLPAYTPAPKPTFEDNIGQLIVRRPTRQVLITPTEIASHRVVATTTSDMTFWLQVENAGLPTTIPFNEAKERLADYFDRESQLLNLELKILGYDVMNQVPLCPAYRTVTMATFYVRRYELTEGQAGKIFTTATTALNNLKVDADRALITEEDWGYWAPAFCDEISFDTMDYFNELTQTQP